MGVRGLFLDYLFMLRVYIRDRFPTALYAAHTLLHTSFRYWDDEEHVRSANSETGICANSQCYPIGLIAVFLTNDRYTQRMKNCGI